MTNFKHREIIAKGIAIKIHKDDYISLTDIAKYKNTDDPRYVIQNWMRNRNTIEYLGLWEKLNNSSFHRVGFDAVKKEAGLNRFSMNPTKWIRLTNAVGIISKIGGKNTGIFAHIDIALEFASWISVEFKLHIVLDYKRLKQNEIKNNSLDWNLRREIARLNYNLHTNAIKECLTKNLTPNQLSFKYADEADILNVALFNKTAKDWRDESPNKKGNIRDYATINELLVLANLENYNSILIEKGIEQSERMIELRKLARTQLLAFEKLNVNNIKKLDNK